jgi:hypothetical protein
MAVKLREKILANGQVSFYLDIYHNQKRWYEFLNIRINRKKPTHGDKEKRRLVGEIRTKCEHELIRVRRSRSLIGLMNSTPSWRDVRIVMINLSEYW